MAPKSIDRGRYHHGDLRRVLLEAGRAMLREGDAQDMSLRELARRVEVSPRAPYRHFASKDALMSALAADGFHSLKVELAAAAAGAPPGCGLRAQAQAYVRFALGDPPMFRLMFSHRMGDADTNLLAAKQATKALLAQSVSTDARPGDDIQARALGCWSLVHGLAILILDGLAAEDLPVGEDVIIERVARAMF